jgi:hypothetical protein
LTPRLDAAEIQALGLSGMGWTEDRDRLIAETLEFVNGASGTEQEFATRLEAAVAVEIKAAANPAQIVPSKPLKITDLRQDIHDRVAIFKARQQHLQDERETYFRKPLDEARATLRS